MICVISGTLRPAAGTYPDELHPAFDYLIPGVLENLPVTAGHRRAGGKIIDPSAFGASNVLVNIKVAVEPLLSTAYLKLSDYTLSGEKFQVSIDCTQADMRKSPPNDLVELIRRRVCLELSELFNYNFSLVCQAYVISVLHVPSFLLIVIITIIIYCAPHVNPFFKKIAPGAQNTGG